MLNLSLIAVALILIISSPIVHSGPDISSLPSQLAASPLPSLHCYINSKDELISEAPLPSVDLCPLGWGKCKVYTVSSSESLSLRFLLALSEGLISYGTAGDDLGRSELLSYIKPLVSGRSLEPPSLPGCPPRGSETRCKPPSVAFVIKDEGGWWGCNSKGEWEQPRGEEGAGGVGAKKDWDAVRGIERPDDDVDD